MTWKDVTTSDDFRKAPPDERAEYKKQYFERFAVPMLREDGLSDDEIQITAREFFQSVDDTGEGLLQSSLSSAARGFLDPVAAIPEVLGAYTGIESLEEFGGDIRSGIESFTPINPAQQGFITDAAGVLGQVGQIALTGGAGAATGLKLAGKAASEAAKQQAIKLGAQTAVQSTMGASAVAGGLKRADELGLEGGDRLLRGALAGGTELLSERIGGLASEIGPAMRFLNPSIEGGYMQPIIRGLVTEPFEEMGAETMGQITDIAMAPEVAPGMDLGNILYAGALGAVGGVAFGGIEGAITPRTRKAIDGSDVSNLSPTPPPGMTPTQADAAGLAKIDANGNLLGYVKPQEQQEPPTAESIEADLPVEIITPEVDEMVNNVTANPNAPATAQALAKVAEDSGLQDAGEAEGDVMDLVPKAPARTPASIADTQSGLIEAGEADGDVLDLVSQQRQAALAFLAPAQAPQATDEAPTAADVANQQKDTNVVDDAADVDTDAGMRTEKELSPKETTKPTQTTTGSNVQMGTEMPVRGESTATSPGVAPQVSAAADVPTDSLPATGQPTSGDVGVGDGITLGDRVEQALYRDDVNAAIALISKEKKEVLEQQLGRFIPVGNAKTAKELRARFESAAPRMTRSAVQKSSLESELKSAERAVQNSLDKQQRHLDGLLGPPVSDLTKDLATDAEQRDPHGIGRDAVAKMWQAEVNAAKDRYERAYLQLQNYTSSGLQTLDSAATAARDTDATPAPQAQPPAATTATQETESKAAAPATVTATEESTAAQPAAVEADVAGEAPTSPASQRLRDDIATLPANAQAKWTPEVLAAADAFYASGDSAAISTLNKSQQSRIRDNQVSEAEGKANDAENERRRKQREGKPLGDTQKLQREMAKLREDYENKPAGQTQRSEDTEVDSQDDSSPRAKAVQAGVAGVDWANMDTEQRRKVLLDFAAATASSLRDNAVSQLGLQISLSQEEGGASARPIVSDGSLSVQINTTVDTSLSETLPSGEAAFSNTYRAIEKEFLHAIHMASAFKRWQAAGSEGDFSDWFANESAKNITDLLERAAQLAAEGNASASTAILDTIYAASTMYWGPNAQELFNFSITTPVGASKLYLETARMLAQVEIDSFTTESDFLRYYKAVKNFVADALALLRESAALVKRGELGEALKRDVAELQSAMRKINESIQLGEAMQRQPVLTAADTATNPNVMVDGVAPEILEQEVKNREQAKEPEMVGVGVARDLITFNSTSQESFNEKQANKLGQVSRNSGEVREGNTREKEQEIERAARPEEQGSGGLRVEESEGLKSSLDAPASAYRAFSDGNRVFYENANGRIIGDFKAGNSGSALDIAQRFNANRPFREVSEFREKMQAEATPSSFFKNKKKDDIRGELESRLSDDGTVYGPSLLEFLGFIKNPTTKEVSFGGIFLRGLSSSFGKAETAPTSIGEALEVVSKMSKNELQIVLQLDDMLRKLPISSKVYDFGEKRGLSQGYTLNETGDLYIYQPTPQIRPSFAHLAQGESLATGVSPISATAAQNSYRGIIPGVEATWIGTVAEFNEQYPAGVDFGGGITTPGKDYEALVARDGRAFIFTDNVHVFQGDADRAEQYGTTPSVEAIKRLLRHESFGHRGFMALPNPMKQRFMDLVEAGFIPDADFEYLVNQRKYTHLKDWRTNKQVKVLAAEEWLAQRIEKMGRVPQSGPVAAFTDWLKDVWRWLTGQDTDDLAQIRDVMRQMHRALGALKPDQRIVMEQDGERMSMVQSQQDREYLAAVEAGDMETAQRMVDEAAKLAMPNAKTKKRIGFSDTGMPVINTDAPLTRLFHGGEGGIVEFNQTVRDDSVYAGRHGSTNIHSQGIWLTPSKGDGSVGSYDADTYAANYPNGKVYELFANITNPAKVYDSEAHSKKITVQSLKDKGYDGAWMAESGMWVAFDSNQIKSADPITYDDNGNIIPLSQRFNPQSSDIRASLAPIRNQVPQLTATDPRIHKEDSTTRSIRELMEMSDGEALASVPRKYHGLAEKGQATEAVKGYAKAVIAPFVKDVAGLIELLSILRSDERLRDDLKLGPRQGAVALPFIAQLAANKAMALGSKDMRDAFLAEYEALASAGGQNLWGFRAAQMDNEFKGNFFTTMADGRDKANSKAAIDHLINGDITAKHVTGMVPVAGDGAAGNINEDLADEAMIAEYVLQLGIDSESDPELRELTEELVFLTIKAGELLAAQEAADRPSLAQREQEYKAKSAMTPQQELEQVLTRKTEVLKAIRKKLSTSKAKVSKEAKVFGVKPDAKAKPSKANDTAKTIINKITTEKAKKGEKPKKQPDPVRELYKEHLKKPLTPVEFARRANAAGLDKQTATDLKTAIDREIAAIAIEAQRRAEERAENKKIKDAEAEVERAQKQAEAKINQIADALADPSLTQDKQKQADPFRELYEAQVTNPASEQDFAAAMMELGVEEATAKQLFDIAALDSGARNQIKMAKDEIRSREMSEAQASKLIYQQEETLRQGSKDRDTNNKGDSINKAFREQVAAPMTQEQFRKRLAALKVSQDTADRLFKTAERIAVDNEAAELFRRRSKLMEVDSAALAAFVNDLRRSGKLTGEKINWKDLLSLPVAHQDAVKAELQRRVNEMPELANATAAERAAIADALLKIWNKERGRLLTQMIKKADLAGVSKDTQAKMADAMPALLRYINQGMLGTSAFYRALGEKYGAKPLSNEARAEVERLAAEYQKEGVSSFERQRLAEKIVRLVQTDSLLTSAEILSSFWVTSVLTGGRTQFDMALGVLNGGFSVAKKMVQAMVKTRSVTPAIKGLSGFGAGFVAGAWVGFSNLINPETGLLYSNAASMIDFYDKGASGAGLGTGAKLLMTEGTDVKARLKRATGVWMAFFERLFAGWDHITVMATSTGTKQLAHALNPKLYKAALAPSLQDYKNAMKLAKERLPEGSTLASRIMMANSLIDDGIHLLGRDLEEGAMESWKRTVQHSLSEGTTASYQEEPTGFGGLIYDKVKAATSGTERVMKEQLDKSRVALTEAKKTKQDVFSRQVYHAAMVLSYYVSTQLPNLLGVRFMRFTGNKLNELISFVPIIGMTRLNEKGMMEDGQYTLRAQNVRMNHALGTISMFLYLVLLEQLDEDDEERGWIVNGPWENLTPARKSQQMAAGMKPNTFSKLQEDGTWKSYNFVSWPFAGWLAAFGSVSDYKRFTPEKWTEKGALDKVMAAAYSGAFALTDISSLSSLTEMFGRSTYSTDPAAAAQDRVVKGVANFAGGFFPKIITDVDNWFDMTYYKPEDSWGHFAKTVPFYRRNAGAPLRDIFYEPVQVSRTPWSRAMQTSPDDEAYKMLGKLNSKGIWLTPANPENRKVRRGGKLRDLTEDEAAKYMAETGKAYKEFIVKHGDRLLRMTTEGAEDFIQRYTTRIREIALRKALAVGASSVTLPDA